MKYRYKKTGIIVESDSVLDSASYTPITEEAAKEKEPAVKKAPEKKTRTSKK